MTKLPSDTYFKGEIRVASRIIDYLSSGLYHSPAACLKELVNNSYDADATKVDIFVKPDADRIIIEDNGTGMNKDEFTTHFTRISESHKRDDDDATLKGRPKIGKIGIGFIAANEICEVMEIFSTKAGSTDLLHVNINFQELRKPPEERRRDGDDFSKADYEGEVLTTNREAHFTQLFLKSIRGEATKKIGEAKKYLAGTSARKPGAKPRSLYGLSPKSIVKQLSDPTLKTWTDFDYYSETMLHIALNIPVAYYPGWVPNYLHKRVTDIEEATTSLDFHVFYDGSALGKPVVFDPGDSPAFISRFRFDGDYVSAWGYFYAQHGTIKPQELQGLLVRIRHAAVGEYDSQFWGFSQSEFPLIQRWVSSEIWADDRLEDAMNVDRRTLRIAHPAYMELREAIHSHLRMVLKKALSDIYKAGGEERKEQRAEKVAEDITDLAQKVIAPISPVAAQSIIQTWKRAANNPSKQKALLRKFSVADLYEVVLNAAKGILPPPQLAKFLKRLTERLDSESQKTKRHK